jgi:hypothetical protein
MLADQRRFTTVVPRTREISITTLELARELLYVMQDHCSESLTPRQRHALRLCLGELSNAPMGTQAWVSEQLQAKQTRRGRTRLARLWGKAALLLAASAAGFAVGVIAVQVLLY